MSILDTIDKKKEIIHTEISYAIILFTKIDNSRNYISVGKEMTVIFKWESLLLTI